MELRHLRYFVVVAEELNFTRAAAELHMSQPPLSQQIGRLESDLGTRLFRRTSRSVSLTEAGRTLLPEARRILAQAEDFRRIAHAHDGLLAPPLRLASVSSGFSDLLPRIIPAFRKKHPSVVILLTWCDPADQIRDLRAGRIDVGLLRTDGNPLPGLQQHVIEEQPFIAALPRDHRLARRRRLAVADLRDEELILLPRPRNPHYVDTVLQACRGAGFSPTIAYQPEDDQVLLGLVASGLGVGILPSCVSNLTLRNVIYKEFSEPRPSTTLCLAQSKDASSRYFDDLCALAGEQPEEPLT